MDRIHLMGWVQKVILLKFGWLKIVMRCKFEALKLKIDIYIFIAIFVIPTLAGCYG